MNTARESNLKSIAVIAFVSVMLFGVFYYLITDATSNPSTNLKAESDRVTLQALEQKALAQNSAGDEVVAESGPTDPKFAKADVKGDSTEISVFKALTTQQADAQPKMVLGGSDTATPESTVPDTGTDTIFMAFVASSLVMFAGMYMLMTQPKNTALAKFEKRIIRDLD